MKQFEIVMYYNLGYGVLYMNELLGKKCHEMYYFGKDKKLKVFFFFFLEIILLMKQTTENIGKCFSNFFFRNATKHRKIFSKNYFTDILW